MMIREEIEGMEYNRLAPYAAKSRETKGRVYPEEEHSYRPIYQRDRDRIIHSTAFRRLEYKTQVFVNHEGDYYRTRLTHTLEVSQIARSIARVLLLNEDLVETIALAHDIGHPPFGHSGEETLRELMKGHGGFDHNTHGLRVVDYLEERYPHFKGLNLTWEVREGINKHTTPFDHPGRRIDLEPDKQASLETQVVDIADEIAYDNHDIDDGITAGLLDEKDLRKTGLWDEVYNEVINAYPDIPDGIRKYQMIRSLINRQITDLIAESERRIKASGIQSSEEVREIPEKLVAFSKSMQEKRMPLKDFLLKNLYQHYRVVRMADKAQRFIRELFNVYLSKPEQLPPTVALRIKGEDTHRIICDYIAGMTDRYALDEYKKLFEPYERV